MGCKSHPNHLWESLSLRNINAVSSESVRTGTPATEDDCEVGSADNSVVVNIAVEFTLSICAPSAEECGEVDTIDCVVARDVAGAWIDFADVWNAVTIRIDKLAAKNLSIVHDAVRVAVGGPFDD